MEDKKERYCIRLAYWILTTALQSASIQKLWYNRKAESIKKCKKRYICNNILYQSLCKAQSVLCPHMKKNKRKKKKKKESRLPNIPNFSAIEWESSRAFFSIHWTLSWWTSQNTSMLNKCVVKDYLFRSAIILFFKVAVTSHSYNRRNSLGKFFQNNKQSTAFSKKDHSLVTTFKEDKITTCEGNNVSPGADT